VSYTPPQHAGVTTPAHAILKVVSNRGEMQLQQTSLGQWVQDLILKGSPDDCYRTVAVKYVDDASLGDTATVLDTITYTDCFITRFVYPEFNKNSNEVMSQTIVIKPGMSADMIP
jgi:hypothetical protein